MKKELYQWREKIGNKFVSKKYIKMTKIYYSLFYTKCVTYLEYGLENKLI